MKRWVLFVTLWIALVVSISAGPTPLVAQTERGEGQSLGKTAMVYDFGQRSCGFWLEVRATREDPSDIRFIQAQDWISGFISAYNWYIHPGGNVAWRTDREGLYAWLDKHCQENPTVLFVKAVNKLIEHLRKR